MRLERIQARGPKGLYLFGARGLDFDFSQVPHGVIAIVGKNGAGKSTFLELTPAAIYREFPSRREQELVDAVEGRDAFIDLQVTFDGKGTYRVRVNLDSVARATDAVLEVTKPDGSRQTLNDGKATTFDTAIAREFPPMPLLLASAFASQKRAGAFGKLDRKARRDLFASLIGLSQYEAWAGTARTAALAVDRRRETLSELVAHLRTLTSDALADEFDRTGNRLQAELGTAEVQAARLAPAVEVGAELVGQLRTKAARYIAAQAEAAALEQRKVDRSQELQRLAGERQQVDQDAARQHEAIEQRRDRAIVAERAAIAALPTDDQLDTALTARLVSIDTALAAKVGDRRERIANNRSHRLDREAEIRQAAADLVEQEARLETARTSMMEADRAHRTAEANVHHAELDHARLASAPADLTGAKTSTALLDRVPCHAEGAYAACELLRAAQTTQASLPRLEARVRERDALTERIASDRSTLQACRQADVSARQQVIDLEQAIAELRKTAALLPDLTSAQDRIAAYEKDIVAFEQEAEHERQAARRDRDACKADVVAEHRRRALAVEHAHATAMAELEALASTTGQKRLALSDREAQIQSDLATIDRQTAEFRQLMADNASAHQELVTVEAELVESRRELEEIRRTLARLEAEAESFARRRDEFTARLVERERLEAAVFSLSAELVEWQVLARILGRDGLPVLEIDAAGPGVSALANDLLQASFGSRFTVDLITQAVKADGKGFKEVFEVRVYDVDRGGEAKDLGLLSGGEEVIVEEALRSAIALHMNQRNVLPIRTCWRDETIGALHPSVAPTYVAMLRRLRDRGGFERVLFVTHNLEAAALADAQIRIEDGRIDVLFPPFAATEAA